MDVGVGPQRKLSAEELMLLNCGAGEDSWGSLELQGDPTSPSWRSSVLGVQWRHWCWRWNSTTLATSCEELTHWKRPWCWERLKTGGEGDDRGWDGCMASPTQWTWVWVGSRSWWWTGKPGVLKSMESWRVRYDWATELNQMERGSFIRSWFETQSCNRQFGENGDNWNSWYLMIWVFLGFKKGFVRFNGCYFVWLPKVMPLFYGNMLSG